MGFPHRVSVVYVWATHGIEAAWNFSGMHGVTPGLTCLMPERPDCSGPGSEAEQEALKHRVCVYGGQRASHMCNLETFLLCGDVLPCRAE